MFKKFALTAVALAAATAASAHNTPSPSSVTLYGVADAHVQSARGDSSLNRVGSGGLSGSRLGLRGSEDLGGGLRGVFTLESGINIDDGTYGQDAFWGRQAFVGLQSSQYGALTLGRQYGSIWTLTDEFSAFGNGPTGATTAIIGGFNGYEPVRGGNSATTNGGPARINNSVKYESPSFGGFRAGVTAGLGEVAGGTKDNRVVDLYARYSAGGLDTMLSFADDKSDAAGLAVRTTTLGAAYAFGPARVLGGYMSVNDRTATNADGEAFWIGGDYRMGQHLVRAQYLQSEAENLNSGKTRALGAGYQYDLSKRTALYSSLTYFKNDGAGYADRWAQPTVITSTNDRDVTEFVAGIRHAF